MFKYKILLEGEPMYFVDSYREVAKLFEYYQEGLDINNYDPEIESIEVVRGEWSIDDIKKELGTNAVYVTTLKDGIEVMACDWEIGYSFDAYLIFTDEDNGDYKMIG